MKSCRPTWTKPIGASSQNDMEEIRQAKLDTVLADLRLVPGLSGAESDDWDSTSIWVFCHLTPKFPYNRGAPVYKFAVPIRTVKASIRHVFKKNGYNFDFLSQPELRYSSMGHGEKFCEGYDQTSIKLNVWIYETPKPSEPRTAQSRQMTLGEIA